MVPPPLPPPAVPPVRPQRLAGRYRLDRCLAIGGMAEVWLGLDEVLDRQVAIKLLHPNLTHDRVFVERLRREAVAVARINHPGIVPVFDTLSDAGEEAVVMEYVPGPTLRQLLDERVRLEVDETLLLGTALADALQAAHQSGIVHRDVKPGNVLIAPGGRVRLTDFGIATAMLAADELGDDGVLLGTAKYVAPEQVQGHLVDGRADLYSLAVVLYECLTGAVPFDGPDERAIALARLHEVPLPVRRRRPEVPVALEAALAAALRAVPAERPPTAAAFRDELRRVPVGAPAAPTSRIPPSPPADVTRAVPVDPTPPYGVAARPPAAPAPAPSPGVVVPTATATASNAEETTSSTETTPGVAHERRISWIVAGLVVAALVTAAIVWMVAARDSDKAGAAGTAPPATTTPRAGSAAASPTTVVRRLAGEAGIVSAAEFDPAPGNGKEHPDQLGNLTDGRDDTTWSTVCYRQPTMAPKDGVGLVLLLSEAAGDHELVLSTPNQGWSASVYVADQVGKRLRDWGSPVARTTDGPAGDVRLDLGSATGRYVLLWFTDLGQPACAALPYQLKVGEVAVVQA